MAARPLTIAQARENVRAAAADLIAAIRSLKTETRSVFTTTTVIVPPAAPSSRGTAARLDPVLGEYSMLHVSAGDEDLIEAGEDTTGFLAAADLAPANIGRGNPRDDEQVFSKTSQFAAVATGAFEVNGVSISVDASSDSLRTLITRINASNAGVTASYDSNSDRLSFTPDDGSSVHAGTFEVNGDLIGVADRDTETNTAGKSDVEALDATLDTMAEYSSVHAGTLTINGHEIAIDPSTTTISSLMDSINDAVNVAATLDERTGRLNIVGHGNDRMLRTTDTSGLLAALGMAQAAIQGARGRTSTVRTQSGTETITNAGAVSVRVAVAIDKLNAALAQVAQLRTMSPETNRQIESAIRTALSLIAAAGVQGLTINPGPPMRIEFSPTRVAESLAKHAQSLPDTLSTDAELRIALSPNRAEADAATTADTRSAIISRAVSQFAAARASNQRLLANATDLPTSGAPTSNTTAANAYKSLEP